MTRASPSGPASGGWTPIGMPPPMPPPLPLTKPPAIVWAMVLCYGGSAVVAWGLLLSTGYVLEPMDGVTRREAAVATAGLASALGLLLLAGHGLRTRRPWGWWACVTVAASGVVIGAYGTRFFVVAAVEVVAGRTIGAPIGLILLAAAPLLAIGCIVLIVAMGMPKARGWFSGQAASPVDVV